METYSDSLSVRSKVEGAKEGEECLPLLTSSLGP